MKSAGTGADVVMGNGAAAALLSQLQLQARVPCSGGGGGSSSSSSSGGGIRTTAVVYMCRALVALGHGCPARAQQLVSLGEVSSAAAALADDDMSATAVAAVAQFVTVGDVWVAEHYSLCDADRCCEGDCKHV